MPGALRLAGDADRALLLGVVVVAGAAGAAMINDVSGLHGDERMAEVAAATTLPAWRSPNA